VSGLNPTPAVDSAEIVIYEGDSDLTGPAVESNLLTSAPEIAPSPELFERIEKQRNYRGAPRPACSDEQWGWLLNAIKFLLPHVDEIDDGVSEIPRWVAEGLLCLKDTRPVEQLLNDFSDATGTGSALDTWDYRKDSAPEKDALAEIFNLAFANGWEAMSDPPPSPVLPPVLQRAGNGNPLSNVNNAITILAQQTTLRVAYDEFLCKALVQWREDAKPRTLLDEDIIRVQLELQRMGFVQMTGECAFSAIKFVAKHNTVNCVADYLNGLTWDSTRRLSELMPRGFGTAADRYHIRAGRNMIIAMVARALDPGCQVDEAVVLEGDQGTLKSSALRVIGGEHFKELTASPNSKDFEQQLQGVWLGEFAELNALRRTEDIARIKQFVTCREDHFRLPYGRVVVDWPRRTVLCGSTNENEWIHDPTGGRRFIPIEIGRIDLDWLRANRDQLFAEAVALYKAGRKWWIYPRAEALARQEDRTPEDPWIAKVRDYLHGRQEISDLSELLSWVLSIPIERQTKALSTRVGITLKKLGCVKRSQRRIDGRSCRPWIVPAEFASQPVALSGPLQFSHVFIDDLTGGAA
jgi:predicted P-loop ATPase